MGNLDVLKFSKDSDRRARIIWRNFLRDPRTTSKPMIPLNAREEDIPPLGGPTKEDVRYAVKVVGWVGRLFGMSLD